MVRQLQLLLLVAVAILASCQAKKVHYIHWNKDSPMFRIDNTDHIIDVQEYDQVNLICPVSKSGSIYPEKHVIYSVTKEEFESCRITNPKPTIVAVCNKPHRLMYFTITFRSFTPTPGGLEFRPGQDYYFISTSSREDLHRRVGGGCTTNNMKMIFKVAETEEQRQERLQLNAPRLNLLPETKSTTESVPEREKEDYVYYYHPRDVIALENAIADTPIYSRNVVASPRSSLESSSSLRFTSSGAHSSAVFSSTLLAVCTGLLVLRSWFAIAV